MGAVTILTLQNYYLPGHRGGGCIRAVSNLVAALGREFDFRIISNDRDLGVGEPYPGIRAGEWSRVGSGHVHYTGPRAVASTIRRLLSASGHDLVYLNSIFERRYAMWPLLLRRTGVARNVPFVIAPRGELGGNALLIRGGRKRAYLATAARLGWFDALTWHATSHTEVAEIERFLSEYRIKGRVIRADDLVTAGPLPEIHRDAKQAGRARIVYLSRIVPKKNLAFALRVLRRVSGAVEFDIYGPREDGAYWSRCEEEMRALPSNVAVRYRGIAAHEDVVGILGSYDLFFFPTLNENFGYAIFEALRGGCPVLLSDQTPWSDVTGAGAGWTLPLDAVSGFARVIEEVVARSEADQRSQSERSAGFVSRMAANQTAVEDHRRLFRGA